MSIHNLQCQFQRENRMAPCKEPIFSWDYGNQTVLPCGAQVSLRQGELPIWGCTIDPETVRMIYDGPELCSASRYTVRVSATWSDGSKDCAELEFDTAPDVLQDLGDSWMWLDNACVHPYVVNEHYTGYSSPFFRRNFMVSGAVKRAVLYASALGVYDWELNGDRVSKDLFAPGWTDYRRRIPLQAYEVTPYLKQGENRLDFCLGDGWYRGFIIFHDRNYGDIPLKLFCCLCIEYTDGRFETIGCDDEWRAGTGTLLYSDFQMGEWYAPVPNEREDAFFRFAVCVQHDSALTARLEPQVAPPIRKIASFTPKLLHWHGNQAILDIGQNIAGFLSVTLKNIPAGRVITLTYGEMLEPDGGVYTANLRIAEQTDRYTTMGLPEESYCPRFTSHGFQYVSVEGICPDEWERISLTAEAISTDCATTGTFLCGDSLVNRLYANILWGQRGNFSSVPTDCPQRNERLGWTGDSQIFCATACYNQDCQTYYQKYCLDMEDGQMPNGAVPDVIPLLYSPEGDLLFEQGNAAWADAGIIIPWRLYTFYHNEALLRRSYPAMRRYAEFLVEHAEDDVYSRADYGDWLNIDEDTPRNVLGTAYAAYDMALMAQAAAVLGYPTDAKRYQDRFTRFSNGFQRHFVGPDDRIAGDTQTAYVVALRFGLYRSDEQRKRFAAHLADRIADRDGHLSSGFVGISYLLPVLCENGYTSLAYDLLLNQTYPSWLYSVVNGATTIWERWNSYTLEGGFGDVAMNSFNHYSLGSVGEWMFSHCAGIIPTSDGIRFCPYPDRRLGWCQATFRTVGGEVASEWSYEEGGLRLYFFVPATVKASVCLPATLRNGQIVYSATERLERELSPGEHLVFLPL